MLVKPLRDRFILKFDMRPYDVDELTQIVLDRFDLEREAASEAAQRGKGNPRETINITQIAQYLSISKGKDIIDCESIIEAADRLGIDRFGLNHDDRRLLNYLNIQTAPVGETALSIALNVARSDLTNMIEPYLLQTGFVFRTPRGRIISDRGREYLKELHTS